MIEKIVEYLLTRSINHKYLLKVIPFLAAKIVEYVWLCKANQRGLDQEAYVIHTGTYDLTTDKTPEEICSEILRVIKEL